MKGLSQTIYLIVVAIVILIVALVLLTIFGGGIRQVASLTDARVQCGLEGSSSCAAIGSLPTTWNVVMWNVQSEGKTMSCAQIMEGVCDNPTSCEGCGYA